jgi:hypothetical protein
MNWEADALANQPVDAFCEYNDDKPKGVIVAFLGFKLSQRSFLDKVLHRKASSDG